MLEALRAEVLEANLELVRRGLVVYTFGNASGVAPSGAVHIRLSAVMAVELTGIATEAACLEELAIGRRSDAAAERGREGLPLLLVDQAP